MADNDTPTSNYELRRQARGAEAPVRARPWRRRLLGSGIALASAVVLAVGFFIWRALTLVHTAEARVQATVVALSPIVDARLLELCVQVSQRVTKGQLLARLDDTELHAAVAAADATRTIIESQYAQADAECRMTAATVAADIDRARARVEVARARVANADAAIAAREAQLAQEIKVADAERRETRARLQQLKRGPREGEIQAAVARLEAAEAFLSLYELEVEQSQKLVQEGIDSEHILKVRQTRLVTQQKAVREAELELNRLRAGPTKEEIEAGEQALANREARLALSQAGGKEVAALKAELGIRRAELREAEAQLKQAEARQAQVSIARERTKAAQAELTRAEAELTGRRAALAARDFVSPVAGTVIRIFPQVGEVCRNGMPAILVTDESKPRWVEGFVHEEDAMLVNVGQRARVRVPASVWTSVDAVVDAVGLYTQTLGAGATAAGGGAPAYPKPGRVWVKIRPLAPLEGEPVTGTTARAVIRVRGLTGVKE